jgi:hypothetical protein
MLVGNVLATIVCSSRDVLVDGVGVRAHKCQQLLAGMHAERQVLQTWLLAD